jgi:hypothetical protein
MLVMPILETARLTIRPFIMNDLRAIHEILDIELADADFGGSEADEPKTLEERTRWLSGRS